MEIEWRSVPGFSDYEASRCGKVRSLLTGVPRVLKQHIKQRGKDRGNSCYLSVSLHPRGADKNKKMTVHRLVCLSFHDNPENKPQINHKDGNSLNNDADNLEWCTPKENTIHAWETGLCKRKWNLTKDQIDYIIENYVRLGSILLAEELKVPQAVVLKYANKHGVNVKDSLFKKVINTSNGKIYNSINELILEQGKTVKIWRRRLSNERQNKTPFRYIDNAGNITEAKVWDIKQRPSQKVRKPIAIFDADLNFIEKFDYPLDVTAKYGIGRNSINEFLRGKASIAGGYKFKLIDSNGDYIEPIPFISKKKPKKIKIKGEVSPPKEVEQYTQEGLFVDRYGSIGLAAKYLGVDKKQFRRQIAKSPTGYARGYNWKVID